MSARRAWTDDQVEQAVGNLLRAGLIVATAVVVAGGAIYLRQHGGETPSYRVFRGEPADLRGVAGIVRAALGEHGRGVLQLGLLLLLATPVARVALSVVAFAGQRDSLYVGVTLVVLGVLLYSIIGA